MPELKTHRIANPSVLQNLKTNNKSPRGQPYIQCGKKIGDEKKKKHTSLTGTYSKITHIPYWQV